MADHCLPAGAPILARVNQIDRCTNAPVGTVGAVFSCFDSFDYPRNIEEGTETMLRNMKGDLCVYHKACDLFKNYSPTFRLLRPDYALVGLLTGQPVIEVANGDSVGDTDDTIGWMQKDGLMCSPWVSLEVVEEIPDEECVAGYNARVLIFPKVRLQVSENPREDVLRVMTISGVTSKVDASTWDSPWGDLPTFNNTDDVHFIEILTNIDLEDDLNVPACGLIDLANNAAPVEPNTVPTIDTVTATL